MTDTPEAPQPAEEPAAGDSPPDAAEAVSGDPGPSDGQPEAIAGADPAAAAIPPDGVPADAAAQDTDDAAEDEEEPGYPEPVPSFGPGTALSMHDNVSDPDNPQHVHRLDADNNTSGGRVDNIVAEDEDAEEDAEPADASAAGG